MSTLSINKAFNIVFVVCHPDDEAIWVGGLLSELSGFNFLKIYVICLSGGNSESIRVGEFKKAKEVSGYYGEYLSSEKLHQANDPLPNIPKTVINGLKSLKIDFRDIDILITHPPFGDEHGNPHHKQAYTELYQWAKFNNVPFGYFSTIAIPFFSLQPILQNMKRSGALHLLQIAKCKNNLPLLNKMFSKSLKHFHTPKYYLEFQSDGRKKEKMINCYNSIDIERHKREYCSLTQNSEFIYIMDDVGLIPFRFLIDQMEIPGRKSLFPKINPWFKKLLN